MAKYLLGIDDAGRGPIIGPMLISGVVIKKEDSQKIKDLGVKDSKLLSPAQRDALIIKIKEIAVDYKAVKITPLEIDTREEHGLNLNDLEAVKMAEAINHLTEKITDVDIYVDCPSVNIVAFTAYLLTHIKKKEGKKFFVEHKADYNYPVCAAASILSKTERDAEIEDIKKKLKIEFGSGYPADPVTKEFIENRGHKYLKYHIIRETWQTWKNVGKDAGQKKLF